MSTEFPWRRSAVIGCALIVGMLYGPPRVTAGPPDLDVKRLAYIAAVFQAVESKREWAELEDEGQKVLPYVAYLGSNPGSDRVLERALIFARTRLSKLDRKPFLEPTLEHLKHHDWGVRAEALMLLEQIGSKEDCVPVAVLLYAEDKHNRIGAAYTLAKLGGKRELLALDLWLADKTRQKDEAFDEVKKSRDELRTKVEDEEKKLKAKPPEKKDEKK